MPWQRRWQWLAHLTLMLRSSLRRIAIQSGRRYSTKQKVIFLDEKQLEALGRDELGQVQAAEHFEALLPENQEPYVRRSPEALFGKKRIGHVELPKSVNKAITEFMNNRPDNHIVRTDALKMFAALRNYEVIGEDNDASAGSPKKKRQQKKSVEPQTLTYGPRETVAYTVGLAPANYGPAYNILHELSNRLSDFDPKSMLDFGTGPGTALWAAQEVFPKISELTGVDISEDMIKMAEYIDENSRKTDDKDKMSVQFRRYMEMNPKLKKPDLVISSYTLGEIPSEALRKSVVEQLWEQTDDILVLIDRGNPAGFERIAQARQIILDRDEDVHVVSPCPHDAPCPMLFSPNAKPHKSWCHFSQRIQRPSFLMKTKHAKNNIEDAKYSYVVLRRGKRPLPSSSTTASSEASTSGMELEAYRWPRLVLPPRKNPRHVVLDVCSKTGEIQRMTIPKSQGKIPYRDARKVMWGDLYPHPPKTKIVTRMVKAEEPLEADKEQEKKEEPIKV